MAATTTRGWKPTCLRSRRPVGTSVLTTSRRVGGHLDLGDESEMLGTVGGFRGLVTLVGEERVGEGGGSEEEREEEGKEDGKGGGGKESWWTD